jgi:acetylornithine deacetylase/succinyl-diaminopimelate desuccinylase-like protein
VLEVQAGEKVYQDFTLTVTNPGGHSSRPVPANAIYQLSAALDRIGAYGFPPRFNDATRGYFSRCSRACRPSRGGDEGPGRQHQRPGGLKAVVADPMWNSMLRTTCVATMVSAGHAPNALPQRATANVNCRILPGTPVEEVKAKLADLAADPSRRRDPGPRAKPRTLAADPPLTPAIMGRSRSKPPSLAGRAGRPDPADRRHRRHPHQRRGHPDLRRHGPVRRARTATASTA